MAQDIRQEDLERCAGLASADARLACFEALTRGEDNEPQPTPSAEAVVAEPEEIEDVVADDAAEEVASAVAENIVAEDTAPAAMSGAAAATQAQSAPEAETEQPPALQQQVPDDFGKPVEDEYVDQTLTATVAKVEVGRNRVLYFHFDNGQVWRQIEGRRFSYPKNREFDVEITTGVMGDYRLRLASGGPMTRIRRFQ